MRRAAHPSGCARCGAGAVCSAMKYQSLLTGVDFEFGVQASGFRVSGYRVRGFRFKGLQFRDTHACRLENCEPTRLTTFFSSQLCISTIVTDTDNFHITTDTVTKIAVRVTRGTAGICHWAPAGNSLDGSSSHS